MPTKSSRPSLRKQPTVIECVDALSTHRRNLHTLARLLGHCGDTDSELESETVRETGFLQLKELEAMHVWLRRLSDLNR